MLDMNEIHLTGRLVRDIELRQTANANPFVWFTLAVNGKKDKDGNENTDFITCQCWGKPAELLATFGQKGRRLLIARGALKSFTKVDEDGTRQSHMYILINSYEFLDTLKKERENGWFGEGE